MERISVISTPYANFYSIYENHARAIDDPSQLPIPRPHAHFYENALPSINIENASGPDNLGGVVQYGSTITNLPFIPPKIIQYYASTDTSIAYEGFAITQADQIANRVFNAAPLPTFLLAVFLWNQNHSDKIDINQPISRRESLQLSALTLWAAWLLASGSAYLGNSVRAYNRQPPLPVLHEIDIASAAANPLDNQIFLRSVIMAARLFTLESFYYWQGIKPDIVYQAGISHQIIDLFLWLGPKAVYEIISYYPHAYIQALMEINGGPRAASSIVLIPVKDNLDPKTNHQHILVNPDLLNIFQSSS